MTATRLIWGTLEAHRRPPSLVEAGALSAWYNEPYNRAMMSNTADLTPGDVIEGWRALEAAGGRPFLLFADGALVGDGDFRHVAKTEAEFAIMVGPRGAQGRGLGTRLSILLHTYAFGELNLDVCYLSIVPANVAGRRCYEKVGYVEDHSCPASRYAEEPTDICMSLPRARFAALHADAIGAVVALE